MNELTDYQRMHVLLEDWARWSERYHINLGAQTHSVGFASGGSSRTFDDLCDAADDQQMEVIDASVYSLIPIHQAAICKAFGLCAVWRFPRQNYEQVLETGLAQLLTLFRKKGVL